jgi:hypothetical protein
MEGGRMIALKDLRAIIKVGKCKLNETGMYGRTAGQQYRNLLGRVA